MTHVLIVRSTLERRLDPKFPTQLQYHIVEVPEGPTENLILYFTGTSPPPSRTPPTRTAPPPRSPARWLL